MSRLVAGDRVRARATLGCLLLDGGSANFVASVAPGTMGTVIDDARARPRVVGGTYAVRFDAVLSPVGTRSSLAPEEVWAPVKAAHIERV